MTGQMVRNLVSTHARQKAGEIRYNHSQRGFLTRSRHESRKVVRNSKKRLARHGVAQKASAYCDTNLQIPSTRPAKICWTSARCSCLGHFQIAGCWQLAPRSQQL